MRSISGRQGLAGTALILCTGAVDPANLPNLKRLWINNLRSPEVRRTPNLPRLCREPGRVPEDGREFRNEREAQDPLGLQ